MNQVTLEEGEEIIEKIQKHLFVYLADFLFHCVACILFSGLILFVSIFAVPFGSYISLIFSVLILFTWGSFFAAWTNHYFDVWYVTNRHIIAVAQKDLLQREESFIEFKRIQDVSFEKDGLIQTWLGYGRLKIQNAGSEQEFVFNGVKDVERMAHSIMGLRDKEGY